MGADIKYGTQPAAIEIQKQLGSVSKFLETLALDHRWALKQGHVYQSLQGRVAPCEAMQEACSEILGKPVEELFTPEALMGVRAKPGPRPIIREDRSEATRAEERRRLEHDQIVAAIHSIAHGNVHGPGGLEGLTMAMMDGIGADRGVARSISDGLHEIAVAIEAGMRAIALGMQGKYDG